MRRTGGMAFDRLRPNGCGCRLRPCFTASSPSPRINAAPGAGATMLRVYACLTGEHDFRLVLVAGTICLLAAFTAFSIFEQARRAERRRGAWTALAGFVAGTGIWATHFVAMLAYRP